MLFYLTDHKQIKLIPSSYLVLVLSKKNLIVNHPNVKSISSLNLYPDNKNKSDYKEKLKKNKASIGALFNTIEISNPANSVVLYADKKEIENIGFNFIKVLCKYIENRYDYPYYEFTNNIDRRMIRSSKLDFFGSQYLARDLKKVKHELQSNKR